MYSRFCPTAGDATMHLDHFRLSAEPFGLTPDPAFLYLSPGHREALAAIQYGLLDRRGFITLVGEVGTGKTTLLYAMLSRLDRAVEAAYIAYGTQDFEDVLAAVLADLGVETPRRSKHALLTAFNAHLLRRADEGRTVALVIDEAQNLSDRTIEQLSAGNPRRANILCHNALLFAYGRTLPRATATIARTVVAEMDGRLPGLLPGRLGTLGRGSAWLRWAAGAVGSVPAERGALIAPHPEGDPPAPPRPAPAVEGAVAPAPRPGHAPPGARERGAGGGGAGRPGPRGERRAPRPRGERPARWDARRGYAGAGGRLRAATRQPPAARSAASPP